MLGSLGDIGNIVLSQQGGLPVLLSDIARIQIGFTPRLGIAGRDDQDDVIFGIVLMQKLERTMDVVTRVRAAVERINSDGSLPPGVKIDAVLRPRRPGRDHRAHGAAQYAVRHRADLPDPVGVPRQSALRADRRGDHPGGLGSALRPSRAANFTYLVAELRMQCPHTLYDERLLSRAGQAALLSPSLNPEEYLVVATALLAKVLRGKF